MEIIIKAKNKWVFPIESIVKLYQMLNKPAVIAAIVIAADLSAFAQTHAYPKSTKDTSRTLIIGGDNNFPPYEYIDEKGDPAGFNVDIIRAIADVMGLKIRFQLMPWADARKSLEQGKVDMLQGMFYSPERERLVDFSQPHTIIHHAVFVRRDGPALISDKDFRNREIIVQKGDIMHEYALSLRLSDKLIYVESPESALRLLASGKHDCALLAEVQGLYLARKYSLSNIVTSGPPFYPTKYCIAVRKGDKELLKSINEGLNIIKSTGRYSEINTHWLGIVENDKFSFTKLMFYSQYIVVPIVLFFIIIIAWNWLLSIQVKKRTRELESEMTAKTMAEVSLKRSREELELIVDKIPALLSFVDSDERFLYVNKHYAEWYGLSKTDLIGKRVKEILPEESYRGAKKNIDMVMAGYEISYENEVFDLQKNRRTVRASYVPHFNEHGTVKAFLALIEDITEQKETENLLKSSLNEKEVLLKEIHHRVKNNLQIVSSLLGLQANYVSNQEDFELFRECQNRVKTMSLVHEKLYQSDNLSMINFSIYVQELVNQLILSYNADRKKIRTEINIEAIYFNIETAIPLAQIINELVSNAIKYAFPERNSGVILVAMKGNKSEGYRLIIEDNGIGIPETIDIRHSKTLGLNLVHELTRSLKADLLLERNHGTRISIFFKI